MKVVCQLLLGFVDMSFIWIVFRDGIRRGVFARFVIRNGILPRLREFLAIMFSLSHKIKSNIENGIQTTTMKIKIKKETNTNTAKQAKRNK